jgi:hypothetical protein
MLLIRGLREIGSELPAPPVSADELQAKLDGECGSRTRWRLPVHGAYSRLLSRDTAS